MKKDKLSIEIYGAEVICASCVNAPSSKDTYEWLQAAIDRKYPNQPYDIHYIDIDAEDIKDACDLLMQRYNAYEGITYSYSLDQEKGLLTENTIIDITKTSFESLYEIGIINDKEASAISLKKTIDNLKEMGFSCK